MMMLGESSTYFTPYWHSAPWITNYNPYGYETRAEDVHYYYTYSPQSDSDSSTRTEYHHMKEVSPPASPKSLFKPYEDNQVKPWKSPEPVKVDQEFCCRWKNCGNSFGSMDALSSHVSSTHSDTNGGLFYCGWEGCSRGNKGFNARYKMLVHVRTHTNEKPHRCTQCEKSFSRAENLKIHVRSHSGEKPYICPVEGCNKAYSNSSDRFKHTRTHSVDRPYFCKIAGCHKRYTDPSSLRKHVKTFKHTTPSTISSPEHSISKYSTVKQEILKRCDPNRTINGSSNGSLSESELYDRTSPAYPIRKYCYSESDRLTSLTPPTFSTFHNEEPLNLGKRNYTAIFENGVLNLDTKTLAVDAPLDLSINRNYV